MDKDIFFDVIVVGNAGIDTNVYGLDNGIDNTVESNFTTNISYVGNSGGYCARGFAQLDYNTSFIGYRGEDHHGSYLLNEFIKDGIDTDGFFIDHSGTAHSINFMNSRGNRKNFYDGKDHMNLCPDLNRCENMLKRSKLAHFSIPNWARYLLPAAKKHNLKISCDIQDIVNINDEYRKEFIEYSDILFFSGVNLSDPEKFIYSILKKYPEKILISGCGKKGCILGDKNGIHSFGAVELDKPVIDTNGAGDGLAVGFLSSYFFENMSIEESILRGQITARYTCSQKADTSNLITRSLLESYAAELS